MRTSELLCVATFSLGATLAGSSKQPGTAFLSITLSCQNAGRLPPRPDGTVETWARPNAYDPVEVVRALESTDHNRSNDGESCPGVAYIGSSSRVPRSSFTRFVVETSRSPRVRARRVPSVVI